MVRRLIKQENVRILHREIRKHNAGLLAIGERLHQLSLRLARGAVAPQNAACSFLFLDLVLEHLHEPLQRAHLGIKHLGKMLVVVSKPQLVVALDNTVRRDVVARDQLEQRGLADTIGTHNGDARVLIESKVELAVQLILRAGTVSKGHVDELQHGRRQRVGRREREVEHALLGDFLRESVLNHACHGLFLGLSLLGQLCRAVAEASNVLLHVPDLLLLALEALGLVLLELSTGLDIGVVVTRVVEQASIVHVDDIGAHTIEKVLRVRNDHQDAVVVLEILLEPHTCLEIQMVGRLVENQQHWTHKQRLGKRNAHSPASRKVLGLLGLHLGRKPKTVENLGRAALDHIRIELVKTLREQLNICILALLHHHFLQLLFEQHALLVHIAHNSLKRRHLAGRHLAIKMVNVNVARNRNLARAQRMQKSTLSAAIVAEKTVSLAKVELEPRVLDQHLAEERQREILHMDVTALGMRGKHTSDSAVRHNELFLLLLLCGP
eukprot:comp18442_c0_seq1/m.32983 comp18442_c0_seq1/g.32983  ORF comp18442_c0_seq1/g.32983 comp18442_c0_seq1/m.32983 type:complete len:495 (-) comp18442_c0_seq1:250-1734(-)